MHHCYCRYCWYCCCSLLEVHDGQWSFTKGGFTTPPGVPPPTTPPRQPRFRLKEKTPFKDTVYGPDFVYSLTTPPSTNKSGGWKKCAHPNCPTPLDTLMRLTGIKVGYAHRKRPDMRVCGACRTRAWPATESGDGGVVAVRPKSVGQDHENKSDSHLQLQINLNAKQCINFANACSSANADTCAGNAYLHVFVMQTHANMHICMCL